MKTTAHTIVTAIDTPDGLQVTSYQAQSLQDAVQYEPDGIYTVTRTYNRTGALELDAHFSRLEESASLLGIVLKLDRTHLRRTLRTLIDRAGYEETRFRITIPINRPDHIYFALEPLKPVLAELRAQGVSVQTFPVQRGNAAAKSNRWMNDRDQLKAQMKPSAYEGILTSPDGELLEGFSSNFYAILNGSLRTADQGILNGISRRIVLTVAPELVPVDLTPVRLREVPQIAEAFMTSSSRGVIPIVQIDDQVVGGGRPGPITRQIVERYSAWEQAHLEPIA